MITIKEECLDLIVSTPTTHNPIQLRFLSPELYKYFFISYPDLFSVCDCDGICVCKKDKKKKTDD